jgi:hypothetical protein
MSLIPKIHNNHKSLNYIRTYTQQWDMNFHYCPIVLVSIHYKNKSVSSMKNVHLKTKKSISITYPQKYF